MKINSKSSVAIPFSELENGHLFESHNRIGFKHANNCQVRWIYLDGTPGPIWTDSDPGSHYFMVYDLGRLASIDEVTVEDD